MSFEQPPPLAAPQPAPGPPAAPIYRQQPEQLVRRPTAWTRPMQQAVAVYLVIAPVVTILLQLVFRDEYRRLAVAQALKSIQTNPGAAALDPSQLADIGLTVALVIGVVFGILYIVLAALVISKPRTWVFWVAGAVLALQSIGLIISVVNLFVAEPSTPRTAAVIGVILGLFAAGALAWMIAGLVKYGPWAQEKVRAEG